MAVTNLKRSGQIAKVSIAGFYVGNGAPASTDLLVTDTTKYGVGTQYYDLTNFKLYIRHAVAGATTDFKSTAALS